MWEGVSWKKRNCCDFREKGPLGFSDLENSPLSECNNDPFLAVRRVLSIHLHLAFCSVLSFIVKMAQLVVNLQQENKPMMKVS